MQKRNVSVTLCILGLIDTASAMEYTRYVFVCRNISFLERMQKKPQKNPTATLFKRLCAVLGESAPAWVVHHGTGAGRAVWAVCPAQTPAGAAWL